MAKPVGMNEAFILASLELDAGGEATIAEVAARIKHEHERELDDGAIYVALQRMAGRGFVTMRREERLSADQRRREIGLYRITADGARAVADFDAASQVVQRLRRLAAGGLA